MQIHFSQTHQAKLLLKIFWDAARKQQRGGSLQRSLQLHTSNHGVFEGFGLIYAGIKRN